MLDLRNPVHPVSPAAQAGLMRLLLECRFDFQNKIWDPPASRASLDDKLSFLNARDALLPLLNVVIAEFSDPSLASANSPVPANRPKVIRLSLLQRSGKTKQLKQKSATKSTDACRFFKAKETRRGRRNFSAARAVKLANF
jgi:hypothetical protein